MIERTFVMIKPDAVVRGLIGEVISRIERKGLKIVGMRMIHLSREEAEELYSIHKDKPFFNELINFVTSAPVVVMAVEGESAISVMRKIIGSTDSKDASPGTIRGDFSCSKSMNIIHASDSLESAKRELSIFFKDFLKYSRVDENFVF
ncbi:MAG: nucleoside-diphosphate kinase [Candidatus Verstraetearchaeota archaeon]|nr:nucleoside-diphosphate kinase [Candidatus Methanomethylicia archaeon]NHV45638.1 nucleoside-diphosphate kinase [Candidatus Verstraetearchaeota archaeon]